MKRSIVWMTIALAAATVLTVSCRKKQSAPGTGPGVGAVEGMDSGIGLAGRPDGFSRMERDRFTPVYFAFDSAVINPHEAPKLETVVLFLRGDSTAVILIEGHCDERGTAEYNRALGERRALAVREALIARGADPARLQTISYGKERPAVPGSGEAVWAKNRRAEFVIVRP